MCQELLHIYGPISIHSYGAMMFLGLIIIIVLMLRDPVRKRIMNKDQLLNTIAFGLFIGILGARLLYLVCNWQQIENIGSGLAIWDGGLSMMGAIIGILIGVPLYLWYNRIPVLVFFDLFALYVPLLQASARIGCFLAGCCYGSPTELPWGICYASFNPDIPFNCTIHPTQLYSSLGQFGIFLILIFFRRRLYARPGQIIALYLILAGFERFLVDFWRGDREFFPQEFIGFLSIHQYLSLLVAGGALISFLIFSQRKSSVDEYI